MLRRLVLLFTLALGGCRSCSGAATGGDASVDGAAGGGAPLDAQSQDAGSPDATSPPMPLVMREGRIFFGRAKTYNPGIAVTEMLVADDGSGVKVMLREAQYAATMVAADGGKSGALTMRSGTTSKLEFEIHDDGTFDGAEIYEDGSKSEYERTPYRGIEKPQLEIPTGFVGFLAKKTRYRVKLSIRDGTVSGVARYPETREDLVLRGTINRELRRISVDEIGREGIVTGHFDALIMGHRVPAPFTDSMVIVGMWTSADGKRTLPMFLHEGFYPDRLRIGSIFLSTQERYVDDCGMIEEYIFPVLDRAPAPATTALEGALGRVVDDSTIAASDPEAGPKRIRPGATVREKCPPDPNFEHRGTTSGIFTATPLHDTWVAIEVEHQYQQGNIRGHVWSDCFAADVATGELVELKKLLDEESATKLTARARAQAMKELPDAGAGDDLTESMRVAAQQLNVADGAFCIDGDKVRISNLGHPVYGPAAPVMERSEVGRLLPAGKLRDLVMPRAPDAGRL